MEYSYESDGSEESDISEESNKSNEIDNEIDNEINNELNISHEKKLDIDIKDSKINNIDNLVLKKKKLIEIAKNLSKIEYLEIFNIIKEDNCQYSENKNGIFINLLNVSENTIDKIFNFISFIKHKKEDLIKHEEYINIAKKNISEYTNINTNTNTNNILPTENVNNIINENFLSNNSTNEINDKSLDYSDEEQKDKNNYLIFSSDEDEDLENKISLKKKKVKYSGKKAKMIKSIRDSNDTNKVKNRSKKNDD